MDLPLTQRLLERLRWFGHESREDADEQQPPDDPRQHNDVTSRRGDSEETGEQPGVNR